jgi:hypothetical protein
VEADNEDEARAKYEELDKIINHESIWSQGFKVGYFELEHIDYAYSPNDTDDDDDNDDSDEDLLCVMGGE